MRKLKILAFAGALLGCTFLATASAATPRLDAIPVRGSSAVEFTPSAEGTWLSWAQSSPGHPNRSSVFVQNGSEPRIKVNARGTSGEGGGFDGDTFVYYQHKGRWAGDIHKFDLRNHRRSNFPAKVSTPWDEYYPTISGAWVLFTRYIGRTQTTKVLLYNTQTRELRTLGTDRGRHRAVYSGQVNGDYVVWGRATPGGADVYLYRISANTSTTIPRGGPYQYDPSVASDGTVYFGRSGNSCGGAVSLVRYTPAGITTVLHNFPAGIDMGHSYVDQEPDGSLQVFFGQFDCQQKGEDIYKAVDSYNVSIAKAGSGTGTVTSGPTGIDCGTACQAIFHGGLTVAFTATSDPGSVFSGWSDASCGTNPSCTVSVESDISLTATFSPSP